MGHSRKIVVSAVNIAMHKPHSPDRYVRLFGEAFRSRTVVRQGTLRGTLLGSLYGLRADEKHATLTGEIYRFIRIDPNEPWFNMRTRKAATPEEVVEIDIPRHLLPHLQRIPFEFRPREHVLYFVAKDRSNSLSAANAARFLDTLLNQAAAKIDLPAVEVTAIPEFGAVEDLLSLPGLSRLDIVVKPPNADDADEIEQQILERLESQNARKLSESLQAKKNAVLKPDSYTEALARVAARNGSVAALGRGSDGLPIEDSTVKRPMAKHVYVDEVVETTVQVLSRVADEGTR